MIYSGNINLEVFRNFKAFARYNWGSDFVRNPTVGGGGLYARHFWEIAYACANFPVLLCHSWSNSFSSFRSLRPAKSHLRWFGSERVNMWGLSGVSKSGSDYAIIKT